VKYLAVALALIAIASFTFIYAGVNTFTDDDYWPDW
jgi:hypothetical protein